MFKEYNKTIPDRSNPNKISFAFMIENNLHEYKFIIGKLFLKGPSTLQEMIVIILKKSNSTMA